MSRYTIRTPGMVALIKQLPKRGEPLSYSDVPHLIFRTYTSQNSESMWWGVYFGSDVLPVWTDEEVAILEEQIAVTLEKISQNGNPTLTVEMAVKQITDYRSNRIHVSGKGDSKLLRIFMRRGLRLEISRKITAETRSYGGYIGYVTMDGERFEYMLYHRGISLGQYINGRKAHMLVNEAIRENHGNKFKHGTIEITFPLRCGRNRSEKKKQQLQKLAAVKVTTDMVDALKQTQRMSRTGT